jgi:hypothetical protein
MKRFKKVIAASMLDDAAYNLFYRNRAKAIVA